MPQPDDSRVTEALMGAGYELGELAGSGGSGVVYRATATSNGNSVAIKLLNGGVDTRQIDREAQALAGLDHPGVARLIEVITVDDQPALVSEWADGQSLAALLALQGPLAPDRAIRIFGQLGSAMDHVHSQGVVHRDLSPDNIMVGPGDTVKLIDFGISRAADTETLTSEGISAGTPRYLAPEVLQGQDATPASDQYSVAVVFYEMLTGQWPYGDSGDTVSTTLHHHLYSAPTPPSEVNEWLPTGIDAVIDRGLAKEPGNRFASVTALGEAASTGSGSRARRVRGLAIVSVVAVAAVVGLVALFIALSGGGETDQSGPTPPYLLPIAGWSAGTAGSLGCNLLEEPTFAQGTIPPGYYPEVADRNAISEDGGVGQTRALLLGTTDDFAFYGEIVPIAAGFAYLFSANIDPVGELTQANMRISWLDENFTVAGDEYEFPLDLTRAGQFTLESLAAPANARYAVPTISKETAPGYLVLDELVFASADTSCVDLLRGTT